MQFFAVLFAAGILQTGATFFQDKKLSKKSSSSSSEDVLYGMLFIFSLVTKKMILTLVFRERL